MNEYKLGQLLFNVRCYYDLDSRHQNLTCYIDGGYVEEKDEDLIVRAIDGTLVDFCNDGKWFTSKNDAIDEAIRRLESMKE